MRGKCARESVFSQTRQTHCIREACRKAEKRDQVRASAFPSTQSHSCLYFLGKAGAFFIEHRCGSEEKAESRRCILPYLYRSEQSVAPCRCERESEWKMEPPTEKTSRASLQGLPSVDLRAHRPEKLHWPSCMSAGVPLAWLAGSISSNSSISVNPNSEQASSEENRSMIARPRTFSASSNTWHTAFSILSQPVKWENCNSTSVSARYIIILWKCGFWGFVRTARELFQPLLLRNRFGTRAHFISYFPWLIGQRN